MENEFVLKGTSILHNQPILLEANSYYGMITLNKNTLCMILGNNSLDVLRMAFKTNCMLNPGIMLHFQNPIHTQHGLRGIARCLFMIIMTFGKLIRME